MNIQPDFEEFLRLLEDHAVDIGRQDLLRNKRATSRARDKADAEELEQQ